MTKKLYDIDSHLKQFEATVLSCESENEYFLVELNQTAFFPEGGGQPSDKGALCDAFVFDVRERDGKILHFCDKPLQVGATVCGTIDWQRRFDFMQQHSGEHILSGIAHLLYGCENVGFHLSEEIVTLDFDKPLSKDELLKIEELANTAVFDNVEFVTYYPEKGELENLKYRSKKELQGDIRIVEIKGVDMCACCAPHVHFAGEIGIIKMLATEKLRGGIRIVIKCGKRALHDYRVKFENTSEISSLLCVKSEECAAAVKRLNDQNGDLRFELAGMKRQIFLKKIESYNPTAQVSVLFEDGLEIKDLQFFADMLYKKLGGIRSVLSPCDEGFRFAICGEEAALAKIFAEFKARFSVKGGGRGAMVQGTVTASLEEIKDFFEKMG